MRRIIVDGLIFQLQRFGGITRTTRALLEAITSVHPDARMELLLTGAIRSRLPAKPVLTRRLIQIDAAWPVSALVRERVLGRYVNPQDAIWHSFYYSHPHGFRGASVVTVHDMAHEKLPALFRGLRFDLFRRQKAATIRRASVVVCVSESTKRDLLDCVSIDPGRVHVVPHAADPVFTRRQEPGPRVTSRRPFMLYVGSRHAYKNFAGLLAAFRNWRGARDVQLVVVGALPTRKEQARVRRLGLTKAVTFAGPVDDPELATLYGEAAALVFPSLWEGFGLPLLEAMASGCPIVASHIPSTVEVAGSVPFYFDPATREAMLFALDMALAEPSVSARLLEGRKLAARYSWSESARQMLEIYSGLASGAPSQHTERENG